MTDYRIKGLEKNNKVNKDFSEFMNTLLNLNSEDKDHINKLIGARIILFQLRKACRYTLECKDCMRNSSESAVLEETLKRMLAKELKK